MTTRVEDPAPGAATLGEPPPQDTTAAESIKEKAVAGVGWTAFIHGYRVGAGVLTTCVLAYLLPESAFGLLGGAAAIVGFLMLLKDLLVLHIDTEALLPSADSIVPVSHHMFSQVRP